MILPFQKEVEILVLYFWPSDWILLIADSRTQFDQIFYDFQAEKMKIKTRQINTPHIMWKTLESSKEKEEKKKTEILEHYPFSDRNWAAR